MQNITEKIMHNPVVDPGGGGGGGLATPFLLECFFNVYSKHFNECFGN